MKHLEFAQALDKSPIRKSDLIYVLRNVSKEETKQRMDCGINLLFENYAPMLIMANCGNTYEEAQRLGELMYEKWWESVILVTHKYHADRAFLTFIKALASLYTKTRIYVSYAVSDCFRRWEIEVPKIEQYQQKGHAASYEEGMEYLKWLSSLKPE